MRERDPKRGKRKRGRDEPGQQARQPEPASKPVTPEEATPDAEAPADAAFEDRFAAVFGSVDRGLQEKVKSLATHEKRVIEWLEASPQNLAAFRDDPIGTLTSTFP
jgi:hypothetical protein